MSGPEMWSPQAAREAVRQATYPNRQTEDESVREVDRRAFERYGNWERGLQQQAAEHAEGSNSLHRVAGEIADALETDVIRRLDNGATPDRAAAQQMQRLTVDATSVTAMLEDQAASAELLADRLEDPAGDFEALLQRLPALRHPLY